MKILKENWIRGKLYQIIELTGVETEKKLFSEIEDKNYLQVHIVDNKVDIIKDAKGFVYTHLRGIEVNF